MRLKVDQTGWGVGEGGFLGRNLKWVRLRCNLGSACSRTPPSHLVPYQPTCWICSAQWMPNNSDLHCLQFWIFSATYLIRPFPPLSMSWLPINLLQTFQIHKLPRLRPSSIKHHRSIHFIFYIFKAFYKMCLISYHQNYNIDFLCQSGLTTSVK